MIMPGELRLDDATIERVVRICDTVIDQFNDAINRCHDLVDVRCFGELESGRQLARGFARKARGTPESLYERLCEHRDAFVAFRAAVCDGGGALFDADVAGASDVSDVLR